MQRDRKKTLNEAAMKLKNDHINKVKQTKFIYTKIDKKPIPKGKNELRLFVVVRNESLRLPYFFQFYSELGVDRIFLIDNNSTDDTREISLSRENVHVFKINESYKSHWYWMEFFLNKYGKNRWCMVVDVDELFYFPFSEKLSLKQLIVYLENNQYTALRSFLLDVYSDKAIKDTLYRQNEDPLTVCQFFDPELIVRKAKHFDKKKMAFFNTEGYTGGVRSRVFTKADGEIWYFNLTKISIFRFSTKTYLIQGMHAINGANLADIEGAVIHTKFLHDFNRRVNEETDREEHYNYALEYKIYNDKIKKDEELVLKYEGSVKYNDTKQLVDLGIMKSSDKYKNFMDDYVNTLHNKKSK